MSNTSDFILNKEDHTLGNLLSEHLKLHPNVYMAGYKRESARRPHLPLTRLTVSLQSPTPTSRTCSSDSRPTAARRRARCSARCVRSSSTSSSRFTRNSLANGSCAASPMWESRATCRPTATRSRGKTGARGDWRYGYQDIELACFRAISQDETAGRKGGWLHEILSLPNLTCLI